MSEHVDDGTGLYWERTATDPTWLAPIICRNDGCWEVERGSLAEKVVTATPEYKDAYAACMRYLKSGEPYASNVALHRQFGSEAEYENSLAGAADDYSLRTVANDDWRCGGTVYPYQKGPAPLSMPIRERIAAEASKTTQPAATLAHGGRSSGQPVYTARRSTMSVPEGLHRDYSEIIHFGRPGWTVDPASEAADAIRKTTEYKAAYKDAVAWHKASQAAEAKATGQPAVPVCEASCDEFALNAAANGWDLEASTDNYTPQAPLVGRPLDVHSLGSQQPAPSSTTRDLTVHDPAPAALAHGGRSL
jgi:hypothetical protein